MLTRKWYLRRAERAEGLARDVLEPGNRKRLLHVAAQLRTKANPASSVRPGTSLLARLRSLDVWHWRQPHA